jgi:DNA-binding beta-propeller fold protein YncE
MIDRRGFLAGVTAVPVLGRAASAGAATVPVAKREIVRRGRAIAVAPNGRHVVVAHDRRRTIAVDRHVVDVHGQPVDVAISADGRLAAVTTGFWDDPALVLVDVARAVVLGRVSVGLAPGAVAFTGKRRILVAGGEQEGRAYVVDARRRVVIAERPIGVVPRGIAVRGADVWIALTGEDKLVRVDARSARVERTLATPALPDRVAISPDGRRLLISHAHADEVTLIDVHTGKRTRRRAGRQPSAVAFTRDGRAVVALGGAGAIKVLGGKRHDVGGAPRGLALAGRRAWTADDLSDRVMKVKL